MLGTPYRVGVLVLALTTLALRAYSVSRSTWIDDDWIFMHQSGSMGLGAFLFQNHQGHVAPAGLLLTLFTTRFLPLDHTPVVVVTALLAAAVVVMWAVAMKEVFGERLRLLAPLAVIALTPLAVRPTMWWAAAFQILPLQVVLAVGVLCAARYARRPSIGGLLSLVATLSAGLLCTERALLAVIPMFATVLFCSSDGLWRTVRRTWPSLVAIAGTAAAYLLAYRYIVNAAGVRSNVSLGADRWPRLGAGLQFYVEGLTNTLAPAVLGGPWGSTPVLGDQLARSALWIRGATTGVLLLLVVAALLARRRAWIPVTLAAGYALVAWSLVLLSNRYLLFGEITIHDERYSFDVLVVVALAAAMVITPALDEPATRAFRRPLPAWVGRHKLGLVLGLALAISLTLGNIQVISRNGTNPAKQWVQNLVADIDQRAPVDLYDTRPADKLLPPPGSEGLLSRMLSPLGEKVSFDGPAETLLVPAASGHLKAAQVTRSVNAPAGPVPQCGYAISSSRPQRIPLDGKLFPYPWGMELTAFAGTPSVLLIEVDGTSIQIPVDKGFARHQVGFIGGVHDVQIALQPGSHPVCVTDLHFGPVKASKRR